MIQHSFVKRLHRYQFLGYQGLSFAEKQKYMMQARPFDPTFLSVVCLEGLIDLEFEAQPCIVSATLYSYTKYIDKQKAEIFVFKKCNTGPK